MKQPTYFDPELLYVECSRCGQPVIWENGEATEFVAWAGFTAWSLDSMCLILTDGCPACTPEVQAYETYVVRAGEFQPSPAAIC